MRGVVNSVMAEEGTIQFISNYAGWQSVKKLKVEAHTDPVTVMEFLASLTTSVDKKVEENLRKKVALEKLDGMLAGIAVGKTENEMAQALSELNSRKTSQAINEICAAAGLQKNEQEELAGFCKVYATRKILNACKAAVDYSGVEIPGMKRVMKKKA